MSQSTDRSPTRPEPRRLACRDVVELATEHFEATLASAQSRRFAAHVAGCRGCQTYLRQLRITVDVAHTVAGREPPYPSALAPAFRRWRGADVDPAETDRAQARPTGAAPPGG